MHAGLHTHARAHNAERVDPRVPGKDSMSSHVFVGDAEGGLKVTRSLGDSPFHKDDAVRD